MTLPLPYPLPLPLFQVLAVWGSSEIDVFKVQGGTKLLRIEVSPQTECTEQFALENLICWLYNVKKTFFFNKKLNRSDKMISHSVLCFFQPWYQWRLLYKRLLSTPGSGRCLGSLSCTTKPCTSAWPSWRPKWSSCARCCTAPWVSSHICSPDVLLFGQGTLSG